MFVLLQNMFYDMVAYLIAEIERIKVCRYLGSMLKNAHENNTLRYQSKVLESSEIEFEVEDNPVRACDW